MEHLGHLPGRSEWSPHAAHREEPRRRGVGRRQARVPGHSHHPPGREVHRRRVAEQGGEGARLDARVRQRPPGPVRPGRLRLAAQPAQRRGAVHARVPLLRRARARRHARLHPRREDQPRGAQPPERHRHQPADPRPRGGVDAAAPAERRRQQCGPYHPRRVPHRLQLQALQGGPAGEGQVHRVASPLHEGHKELGRGHGHEAGTRQGCRRAHRDARHPVGGGTGRQVLGRADGGGGAGQAAVEAGELARPQLRHDRRLRQERSAAALRAQQRHQRAHHDRQPAHDRFWRPVLRGYDGRYTHRALRHADARASGSLHQAAQRLHRPGFRQVP